MDLLAGGGHDRGDCGAWGVSAFTSTVRRPTKVDAWLERFHGLSVLATEIAGRNKGQAVDTTRSLPGQALPNSAVRAMSGLPAVANGDIGAFENFFYPVRSGEAMIEMMYQTQWDKVVDGSAGGAIHHPFGRWRPQPWRRLAAKCVGDGTSFHDQFLNRPHPATSSKSVPRFPAFRKRAKRLVVCCPCTEADHARISTSMLSPAVSGRSGSHT